MTQDAELLAAVPDFLSIESMFKALPAEEAGRRFIYFQASNEGVDQQNEIVLAKALEESAAHYLKFGNVDIDHYTVLGKPNPAKGWAGIPKPELYEIGRPVQVRVQGRETFVKAELYQGDGELATNANMVWEGLTGLNPPARWYPSVGGAIMAKSTRLQKDGTKIAVVEKVRWTNVGLSRTPVNQHIPNATTVAFGALAKCWGAGGLEITKALTAGYATDSAAMTGGQALSTQSLDGGKKRRPRNYFDLREDVAGAFKAGRISPANAEGIHAYCMKAFGMSFDEAAEHTDRFIGDLKRGITKRSNKA